MINIFDRDAKLNEAVPAEYQGMDRFDARAKIIAAFEEMGLLEKIEPNAMTQPYGDRSGVVIEPWLTDQWFVDAETLAKPAIEAVQDGRMRFVPKQWENTYFEWMRNIQPWCISRQIWWGHQVPAWFAPDGKYFVALTEEEAQAQADAHYGEKVELKRDTDVLDTWFSSALWPFSTLGWPQETDALKKYYPTSVLVTGFDIIFFWVARMMMMGMKFMDGQVPFKDIYIHALVRDEKGQKMSKSKGNIIDPLDLIDKFGCDALRFTLTALAAQGRDIKLAESRVEGFRNFATKLWNASRFCEMNECKPVAGFDPQAATQTVNRWMAGKVAEASARVAEALDAYRFNDAAQGLYQLVWNVFCDWYLEFAKPIFQGTDEAAKAETRATAAWSLQQILKLLHPVMPFITEELWEQFGEGGSLMLTGWPKLAFRDEQAVSEIDWLVRTISEIRTVRAEMNVPPSAKLSLKVKDQSALTKDRIGRYQPIIQTLARLDSIETGVESGGKGAVQVVVDEATLFLPLGDVIDLAAERVRLEKEIGKLDAEIAKLDGKLNNEAFVAKAKPEVVEEQRERRAEADAVRVKLADAVKRISA
jgi:valyl-tRNA synthetase